MVNADNEAVYCKFHYKTDQGIKCFDRHQADEMAKQDPDYAIRSLVYIIRFILHMFLPGICTIV